MIYTSSLGHAQIILKVGDITKEQADIIVNAANPELTDGSGVNGAIHRVGGKTLALACENVRTQKKPGERPCPYGSAVLTKAWGGLKAKHVIHAVGPDMRQKISNGAELLESAYKKSLDLAKEIKAATIAFPSISTGIYAYPIEQAAAIVFQVIEKELETPSSLKEIRIILFTDQDFDIYKKVFEARTRLAYGE